MSKYSIILVTVLVTLEYSDLKYSTCTIINVGLYTDIYSYTCKYIASYIDYRY